MAPSDDPQPQTGGVKARKGGHQTGKSCKRGCVYHFLVKVYAKCADMAVIKFPCKEGDSVETCVAMQHILKSGMTHEGQTLHLLKYTDEIKDFVITRLRAPMKTAVIMSGANRYVLCLWSRRKNVTIMLWYFIDMRTALDCFFSYTSNFTRLASITCTFSFHVLKHLKRLVNISGINWESSKQQVRKKLPE
jgi:hypothetical protein